MKTLAETLPPNTAVIDEAPATSGFILEKLVFFKDTSGYFAHRGWALGWGIGCAIGVKLALPDRPVAALLGDGAALFGIQGLWTAAHYGLPVTFIIANNAQYKILKLASQLMSFPQIVEKNFPAMNLVNPEIDFVGLGRSLGIEAHGISEPEELGERLRAVSNREKPMLLDVRIE